MANTIARSEGAGGGSFDFIKILLRGTGQVMFQNSAWTGLLFMVGIFWGAYAEGQGLVAWGALLGVIVSTVTGYILGFPARDGEQGLWGFNGVLVGCAFPTFMGNTVWMWLALVLCAALTTWVRTGFNNVMAPWKVNSFTFPFVFCTWMFLLAARAMHGLPTTHMADPALPAAFPALENIRFGDLAVYWLKGIGQVFLINSWVTGICFLAGLFLCSRWAALWAAIGSALALLTVIALKASGPDISEGLYGYSPVLTAIALATVFYKPNFRSALWAAGDLDDGVRPGRHVCADGARRNRHPDRAVLHHDVALPAAARQVRRRGETRPFELVSGEQEASGGATAGRENEITVRPSGNSRTGTV